MTWELLSLGIPQIRKEELNDLQFLASGGSGLVFKAKYKNNPVAVKKIKESSEFRV